MSFPIFVKAPVNIAVYAVKQNIERYRIHPEDVIHTAEKAVGMGYKTIVLQSGEDKFFSQDIICEIIKEIKNLIRHLL